MSYNFEELTYSEAKDLFRQWRENNERRSEDVIELWTTVFSDDLSKLGNEKHLVLEQVIYAALDCHAYGVATMCIYILSNEFPGSMRVMRHKAALLEAKEQYDEALEVLDGIIKADETNSAARKRRVAILKAQGLITEAIKELVDYLKKFMSDVEAWQELCSLYLQVTNNLLNHYKSAGNSSKRKEVWKLCQWAQSSAARRQRAARALPPTPDLSQMMLALAITE
ncbi:hypothetical protein HF086_018311 [Spodoptera exigua]|uniref:ER membrane protein complex subunit 2 n=1 Tax=Spodoptera exigua TaxID=7107 RepID=A0A922M1F9_SPOEX|nr:hypothetical protein HF086_018311 [Spodoptera exigua]